MEEKFFWYCEACNKVEGPLTHDFSGFDKIGGLDHIIGHLKSYVLILLAQGDHSLKSSDCEGHPRILGQWLIEGVLRTTGLADRMIEEMSLSVAPRSRSTGRVQPPGQEN